jgi:NhaP-type Na+/H+ or K+/H+ antiporter
VIAVSVLVGFLLGAGGLGVVDLHPGSGLVDTVATIALVAILFRDGIEVELEMLRSAWRLPLRKLVLAMPLTAILVACATKALTDLGWTESFLVGALLSPTDPVLSSSVVTNPRVPRVVRHSLNLESGLNDGLALPAVLAFAYSLDPDKSGFVWWKFVLQDVSIGFASGIVVGLVAAWLVPRREPLLALAAAFAAYGVAVLPPHGNGLIAAFVCAITLGIRRHDVLPRFERRAEGVMRVVKIGVFLVFGSLLTLHGLFGDGLAAVAIAAFTLLIARPVAVFAALAGTRTDRATRAFMAWFGPKGVATMTFSLLVLSEGIAAGSRVFNIASLAVVISIVAHGATDRPGSEWMGRHAERVEARGSPVAA